MSHFVNLLGNRTRIKILDFLIDNQPFEFTKADVVKGTKLSRAIVFRNWKWLERFDLIIPTKNYGRIQLFVLNKDNKLVKDLIKLDFDLTFLINLFPKKVKRGVK
jgi:hypothetical protein